MPRILRFSALILSLLFSSCNYFTSSPRYSYKTEARQYIGSLNRAQQAYYVERNQLTALFDNLGLRLSPETRYYQYSIVVENSNRVFHQAKPKLHSIKGYMGAVFLIPHPENYQKSAGEPERDMLTIICESNELGVVPQKPYLEGSELFCAPGSTKLEF